MSSRKLREQAALYNLLATNGITTMQQLHEKVDAMNAQYYKLRGEIVSAERRIATLEERLDMFEKYEKNKAVQRQYVKVKPAKREQFEQSYRAELTLYKAAVRYLENLKTEGEPVTPKKWRSEVESLTAQKNLQYQEMRAMREEIKAVLFSEVSMDVLQMTGNDHTEQTADPLELAEIKRRWNPYIDQLPEYAYICDDLLSGRK